MGVQDGQNVNAAVTNAALMSRLNNTSTIGRVDVINATDSTLITNGAIHTTGGAGIEKNLNVGQNLSVDGNADIDGTLNVDGSTTLQAIQALSLNASGLVQANDVTATDILQGNSLNVVTTASVGTDLLISGLTQTQTLDSNGLATLNSANVETTLGVTGATTLSTVSTSGAATLNSASVTNNATVGGTLTVTGDTTLNGNLTVTGTTTTVGAANLIVTDRNILINNGGTNLTAEGAGLTVDRVGTDGSLIYKDASASKFAAGPLGSEVDLVNVSGTQTLTNKTIDASLNTITNLSAGSLSGTVSIANGGTGQNSAVAAFDALAPTTTKGDIIVYNGTDNIRLPVGTNGQVPIADSAQPSGIRWGAGGAGSGGGSVNFITNGDAEDGSSIWVNYNDRIGSPTSDRRPIDGSGGSPTVSNSITGSALRGTNAVQLSKPAGDCQGQGWSTPNITIPLEFRAKPLSHYLAYLVQSGTFIAGANGSSPSDGDLIVYWWDATNGKVVESSNIKFFASSTTISDSQIGTVQFDSNCTTVRMLLHIASQNTAAWNLIIDSAALSPQLVNQGAFVTSPVAFTPAGTWTNSTYTGEFYSVGKFNYYHVRVGLIGTPTGGVLNITLPHTIDTADLATGTTEAALPFASGTLFDNGSFFGEAKAFFLNTTTVQIRSQTIGNAHSFGQVTPTAPVTFISGDSIDVSFAVPILGQSGSVKMSEPYDGRRLSLKYTSSSTTPITGSDTLLTFGNRVWDDAGLWSGNQMRTPSAGEWEITLLANLASASWTNGAFIGLVFVNNVFRTVVSQYFSVNGSPVAQNVTMHGSARIQTNANDLVQIYAYQTQTATINQSGSVTLNTLEIRKVDQSQAIAAGEKVRVIARCTNSPVIAFNTGQTIIYNQVLQNSHGWYNPSTGVFTAGRAGTFKITASARASVGLNVAYSHQMTVVTTGVGGNDTHENAAVTPAGFNGFPTTTIIRNIEMVSGQTMNASFYHFNSASASTTIQPCTLNIEEV